MIKVFIIVGTLLFVTPTSLLAWGVTGHRVTGYIAEKYLKKRVKKRIHEILDGQSLAEVSTWMDEIRSDSNYNYMLDWHWVTVPRGKQYAETVKNPNGDIIQTIERVITELEKDALSRKKQAELIKVLVHLIGDIHQPLHVGAFDDMGGNAIKVLWFGRNSNLHKVWDSEMIDDTKLGYTELAEFLPVPTKHEVNAWQRSDVHAWAIESQSYIDKVYDYGDGKLGYQYTFKNFSVVEKRLLEAGVRLAGVLNRLFA